MDLLNKTENPDSLQAPASVPTITTELHPISKPELESISGPVSDTPPASVPPPAFTITPVQTPSADSHFANFITNSTPAESLQTPIVPAQMSTEPVSPVVPPPPIFSNQIATKSHGSKKSLIIVISIVLVLLLGGGVYAYFFTVSSKDIFKTLSKVDSAPKVHVELKLALDTSDSKLAGMGLDFVGEADKSGQGISAFQGSVDLKSSMYSVDGEFRYIDNKIYGIMRDVPRVPNYLDRFSSSTLKSITGTWYSVSLEQLKKLEHNYKSTTTMTGTIKYESLSNIYMKLDKEGVMTKFKLSGFGNVSGGLVRKYTTSLDKAVLAKVFMGTLNDNKNNIYLKALEEPSMYLLELADFSPITISVSLFGSNLRQISFRLIPGATIKQRLKNISGIDITLDYDESKNNFSIVAPDGTLSMDGYIENQFNEAKLKGLSARIQAEVSQARAGAELYFDKGKGYAGLCTKDTGLKNIFTDLSKFDVVTSCRASTKAYMVAAKLPIIAPATTTSYFCVDSTGLVATLNKSPLGYACK